MQQQLQALIYVGPAVQSLCYFRVKKKVVLQQQQNLSGGECGEWVL